MRPAPSPVIDMLASRRTLVYADCYTFELIDGTKLYFTSAQQDVYTIPIDGTIIAQRWLANKIRVSGLRMRVENKPTIDEQELQIDYQATDLIDDLTWGAAAAGGELDGAVVRRDRFFAEDWFSPWLGGAPLFVGRVGQITEIGRTTIKMKVKSYLVLADINMPRELTQPSCRNTVYDPRCKLVKATFGVSGAVGAGSGNSVINWAGALTSFSLGTITMTSGPSVDYSRTIKQATGSQLILTDPLPFEPGVGDTFLAYPGCDRTVATCSGSLFNNLPNHNGFPFVPPPETAV